MAPKMYEVFLHFLSNFTTIFPLHSFTFQVSFIEIHRLEPAQAVDQS